MNKINSKRKKNGFTMVELLAVVALLAVIAAIVIPVSLNYVKRSKENAFYLNVQEIVKKVKEENELNRVKHCYYNYDLEDEDNTIDLSNYDNIKHLTILSYVDNENEKTKYAVYASEKETEEIIDAYDFDKITSEKNTWNNKGEVILLTNALKDQNSGEENSGKTDEKLELLLQTFQKDNSNQISNYIDNKNKCQVNLKEGN